MTQSRNPYQVFHKTGADLRKNVHIVMVRPTYGGNLGSTVRGLANMGIVGDLRIIDSPQIVNGDCLRLAKHARDRLETLQHFPTLAAALAEDRKRSSLVMAATARVGSAHRPHPLWVRPALEKATQQLQRRAVDALTIVFGPEDDGLRNEEVELCDWVVTIPSANEYRSLNLSQAILIFAYEVHLNLLAQAETFRSPKPSQKERLVQHVVQIAEDVGFVLPGDPFKMRPRLEQILGALPPHIEDVKTLHGLLAQILRTVHAGKVQWKGRYRHRVESTTPKN